VAKKKRAATRRVTRRARIPKKSTGAARRAAAPESPLPAGVHLSINQAAQEFGHDRATIAKRVRELGLSPAGERQGHPVFRLRDLLTMERHGPDGDADPDKMSPFERQAHYKAESEKQRVNLARGQLMQREAAEVEWSRVLRVIALELDTVVDEIERDVGASQSVLEKIEAKLDVVRERMYESIIAESGDEEHGAGAVPESE
jgi:hypothetical protein